MNILIWFGLLGITATNPPLGGLCLIFGYTLGDKAFALINIASLISLPLFITEPVLIVLLIRATIIFYKENRFQDWLIFIKSPWLWFYGIGFLNILIGLLSNAPILVLRDAMIVFYGLIAQITIVYVRDIQKIKIIFFVVLVGLLLRFILQFFNPFFDHRSTTFGMYSAFIVIGSLCTLPLWNRFSPFAIAVIFLFAGIITATDIRTVWLGLFITYLFILVLYFMLRMPYKQLAIGSAISFSSIFLTVLFMRLGCQQQYDIISNEFSSMFAGKNSPNLMTRVAMWEDAIQEVIPAAGHVFDVFDRKELNIFLFGTEKRPVKKQEIVQYISKDNTATDILNKYEETAMPKPVDSISTPVSTSIPTVIPEDIVEKKLSFRGRISAFVDNSKILKALFGIPFGKRFFPERISQWHHVNRYDPHNSLIAIFYRTGLIGFLFFFLIIGGIFRRAFTALKRTTQPKQKYVLLAVMSCAVYHIGHSMTDVTLENPFRGIPFWLLLGLVTVLSKEIMETNK